MSRGLSAVEYARGDVDDEQLGTVVPLFRGAQGSERPLGVVAGGLWTQRDAAAWLQVSPRTVRRWQLEEGLPHEKPFRKGGPVRYVPAHVMAWWSVRCQS